MRRPALLAGLVATALAGCTVQPPGDTPVDVVRGPLPTTLSTPMAEALQCVNRNLPRDLDIRLAVHSLPDRTGVNDYDGPGAYVTQGAELMMISALAKAGARQVNRTATSIAEWELSQAMEKRLGEGGKVMVNEVPVGFRPIQVGYYLGSTHTIYGGITELDFDLVSDGIEAQVAGVGGKARGYYISIGLDVIVADSRSTEIVLARSYRKQVWGQELEANLFRFWDIGSGGDDIGDFGVELFDLRLGRQENEPIHQSVRWVVEQAAYEVVRDLAGLGAVCEDNISELSRSEPSPVALAVPRDRQLAAVPQTTEPAPLARELDETPDAAAAPTASVEETTPTPVDPAEVAGPTVGEETVGRRAVRLPNGKILVPQDR
jgi:curli biogenesis system outer membrane secretion channel CsgG